MEHSSSSEDEHDVFVLAAVAAAQFYTAPTPSVPRVRCRTSALTGTQFVKDVLTGHPTRCQESFRMPVNVFWALCNDLATYYMLAPTHNIAIPEMVGIFLFTLAQGGSNRLAAERFQHSTETISRLIHRVLNSVKLLAVNVIKPRENQFTKVPAKIMRDRKLHPFRNTIGSMDRTHVPTVVPRDQRIPYINRKGVTSQNVLAICDFDMIFLFVAAGFEGSGHDARVLDHVLSIPGFNFPHPPEGKYYLVDSRYLALYRGERYHLPDWNNRRRVSGPRERFNCRHAHLRNVIERTFGVTKQQWKILRDMSNYEFPTQVDFVYVCCGLHNYIRQRTRSDEQSKEVRGDSSSSAMNEAETSAGEGEEFTNDHNMGAVRDRIATALR